MFETRSAARGRRRSIHIDMNIQSVKCEGATPPAKLKAPAAKAEAATVAEDAQQTRKHEKLLDALRNERAARAEETERGRALASDPNYPSPEMIEKLAGLFVDDAGRSK